MESESKGERVFVLCVHFVLSVGQTCMTKKTG